METVFRFYVDGKEVKRSVFSYDEELRRQLEVIECAVRKVYEKSGEWIREVEVSVDEKKKVKWVVVDEREELKKEFRLLVGRAVL
jgi:hypothetical protein